MWQRLAILFIATSLGMGCRQNPQLDAYLELMNAERRGLEERVVDLEAELAQARRELERYERSDGQGPRTRRPEGERRAPEPVEDPDLVPPTIEIPRAEEEPEMLPESPALQPPQTEPGTPFSPTGYTRPPARARRRTAPAPLPAAARDAVALAPSEAQVTQLHVAPVDSDQEGISAAERAHSADLFILVEPRDARGRFQAVSGELRVMASAVAETDEQRRELLAVWEMSREEVSQALKSQTGLQAIHLHLPWPTNRPAMTEPLQIDVRFTTEDGRRLVGRTKLTRSTASATASPPTSQQTQTSPTPRWTPRTGAGQTVTPHQPTEGSQVLPASRTTSSTEKPSATNWTPRR
jgi:hypothetical protein